MNNKSSLILRAEQIATSMQTFSHPWNPRSEISGTYLGRTVGLKRTGVNFAKLAPGKESFIYHSHYCEEEWMYILSGHGTAEINGEEFAVGVGDFIGFPTPSVAHHLRNTGDEDLVYLMGGENLDVEIADFPKLGKRMLRRGDTVEIYDVSDAKPFGPLQA
ncbi:cupin domain-containing protein [Leptolyngbya sp. NK1-12]|uniref:Cupin domain-containing protein n=1 Tax=Leptolyngbya sp. NK1-12 TaxID=2547451 RepID=A0AA96WH10_9CYAN|nr:cupin domain-containing protein [Leptolyngbya sp. NK1-12]